MCDNNPRTRHLHFVHARILSGNEILCHDNYLSKAKNSIKAHLNILNMIYFLLLALAIPSVNSGNTAPKVNATASNVTTTPSSAATPDPATPSVIVVLDPPTAVAAPAPPPASAAPPPAPPASGNSDPTGLGIGDPLAGLGLGGGSGGSNDPLGLGQVGG